MNGRLLAIAVAVAVFAVVAQVTRFEPLATQHEVGLLPLWDRWLHRVCFVVFAENNRLACSAEALSGESSDASSSKTALVQQIGQLRAAGFTDKEIVDYVLGGKVQMTRPDRKRSD